MKYSKAIVSTIIIALMAFAAYAAIPAFANTGLLNSNQLNIQGSSTVYPISVSAQVPFEQYVATLPSPVGQPNLNVILNNQGSGGGIQLWEEGQIDMAASSKTGASGGIFGATYPLTTWSPDVVNDPEEFTIGQDSVAIIVPSTNTWLTQADAYEIQQLFTVTQNGGTTPVFATWQAWASTYGITLPAGMPANQAIDCIGREFSSGTFDGFNTFFLKPSFGITGGSKDMTYSATTGLTAGDWTVPDYQQITNNQGVLTAVASDPYSIGFIGLGFVQNDLGSGSHPDLINAVNLYNPSTGTYIVPSIANVKNNIYVSDESGSSAPSGDAVIIRWLWYYMDGIPQAGTPAAIKSIWISYVRANPQFISGNGYMTINPDDFAGASAGNPNTSVGTQTVPTGGAINYADITYFVSAYIAYNGPQHILNPYADFSASGSIGYTDITTFVSNYIAANS